MGNKTGVIAYNVKDRGRRYRGQNRNFDCTALAAIINGGDVQERVKHRDMLGYFGHWPRVRFGMNPTEGGILDGRVIAVEPAIVTTMLKANPDGTIEHETEFLDTAAGKLAEKLYASKAGGFSSAIDTKRCGDKSVPIGFYGFDYVLEPNYTTNRGYKVLDGVEDEAMLALYDDATDYQAMFDAVNGLYDSLQGAYDMQAQTLLRIQMENEQLMSMLMKAGNPVVEVALDGIAAEAFGGGEGRLRNAGNFIHAELPSFEQFVDPDKEKERKASEPTDALLGRMFSRAK